MTPWVSRLLIANILVYFLQLSLKGATGQLALVPALLLQRPWTILTYMFAHSTMGFSHIAFNMLALYIFGPRVELRLGGTRFITLYLIAGISGGLLSLVFTPYSPIVGASGAIFGVQLAFAKFFPRERIFIWGVIPVEARLLVLIMTVISVFGGLSGGGSTAHFAHLGGYVGAFFYLLAIQKSLPKEQWVKKVEGPAPHAIPIGDWNAIDLTSVHELNRGEVQRIVDKIKATGERSLSVQERQFLGHFTPKA
ncbi:MAG: rhomboid family intramembrane serine protease [Gemmatimonadaceae bacterium]|nr:rhomboid family intramembrane serine protease [Gemmatimonadaceae bacterium]